MCEGIPLTSKERIMATAIQVRVDSSLSDKASFTPYEHTLAGSRIIQVSELTKNVMNALSPTRVSEASVNVFERRIDAICGA